MVNQVEMKRNPSDSFASKSPLWRGKPRETRGKH